MQYREVPKNGDKLSVLGYGCMRLPVRMQSINQKLAEKQILYAMDQGVNYLDTAYPYHSGKSEPFLGKVLSSNGYRNDVKIATKLPHWMANSKADMDKILDEQLSKLKTDRTAICGIKRHGGDHHGAVAGREPGQKTAAFRKKHLGQSRAQKNARGLVP